MADLYLKKLESQRKTLWATCRLKGLPKDTPGRQRIAEIDRLLGAYGEDCACSMKISAEVREFARLNAPMPSSENPDRGMAEISERFHDERGELYVPATKWADAASL
jgi:hypothetical protein